MTESHVSVERECEQKDIEDEKEIKCRDATQRVCSLSKPERYEGECCA